MTSTALTHMSLTATPARQTPVGWTRERDASPRARRPFGLPRMRLPRWWTP